MSTTVSNAKSKITSSLRWPDAPLVIWMVVLTLILGIVSGLGTDELVKTFNKGFGRALGEFALILLPSSTIAAAMSHKASGSDALGKTAVLASPIAGAGMICPDTAYAALAPAAGRFKLALAFGAYTGFKLLYPAGPLIVAAGLGVVSSNSFSPLATLAFGIGLSIPVWLVGVFWAKQFAHQPDPVAGSTETNVEGNLVQTLLPFVLLTVLMVIGSIAQSGSSALDFFLTPKGALIAAAALSLFQTPVRHRRACLDSAVRRTGSLLLIIGAASAFGAIITGIIPFEVFFRSDNSNATLLALFAITIAFKLAQGSSMATFAAVAPVTAPLVAASGTNLTAAIFAICLGSFVAILPNDSFYWLVRKDALSNVKSEAKAILLLTGGSVVQALVGMAILLTMTRLL